jgi:hypothetical protein
MAKKYQRRPWPGGENRSPRPENEAEAGLLFAWAAQASYPLRAVLMRTKSQTLLLSLATAG